MYNILLIICFVLTTVTLNSQLSGQARIDSLLAELPLAKGDSNEVKILIDLSFSYNSINPDKGIEYGEKSAILSKKINWKKGLADSYNSLGANNSNKSNNSKALDYYKKALTINQELGYEIGIASNLSNIGIIYLNESNYSKALDYYHKALKFDEKSQDKYRRALTLGNIGIVYLYQSDYRKALEYYKKALRLFEEINDSAGLAQTLGNIATIYKNEKDYSSALNYYKKALKVTENTDNKGVSIILGNIGVVHLHQSNYIKALEYYHRALKINEKIDRKYGIAVNLANISEIYLILSQDSVNIKPSELNEFVSLKKSINLKNAIEYSKESISIFKMIGELDGRSQAYNILANAYKLKGNYRQAFEAFEVHKQFQDSVFNLDKEKEIASLTAVREKEVAEKELVISQLENDQRKKESYVLYGGLAFLALVIIIIFKQRRQSEKLLLNILPAKIAKRLKKRKGDIADDIENASTVFIDLVGFTAYSKDKKASDVLKMLNQVFSRIDKLVTKHGLEKIKTIGDGYMAAAGVPDFQEDHSKRATDFSIDIHNEIEKFNQENETNIRARIGIESGPMVAGVIGEMKFIYDLWGDSVNTASRMESTGLPDRVQITENVKNQLSHWENEYSFEKRQPIEVKGRGMMQTYFVEKQSMNN